LERRTPVEATMPDRSTLLGLFAACAVSAAFLASHLRHRRSPDLVGFLTVFLAGVAVVSAADFGRQAVLADFTCLPSLDQHRLIMILGSIATVWLGIREVVKAFNAVLSPQQSAGNAAHGPEPAAAFRDTQPSSRA
jgi:hypothetical protein